MMGTPMTVGLSRLCPTSTSNPCVPRPPLVPCNRMLCNQNLPGTSKGNPLGRHGTVMAVCWKREPAKGWSTDLCTSKREYRAHRQCIELKRTTYGLRRA